MAEGLNKVFLLGNLVADPELRVVSGGQALMKMRVATTESYLDRNNARQEKTEYHTVSLWGKRAESLAKFLTKGTRVHIEGSLSTSSYEKDGEKRYRTEVKASNVLFANARQETERTADRVPGRAGEGRDDQPRAPTEGTLFDREYVAEDDEDSDLPF